ncbi:HNH endonuclease signature motif containing protein [Streptomyces jumonjinensis]|uniref:HNH endonuclease n=1 Tax=Streptomyces jumonjinensis TaxID=1945 RepID=A0A646KLG9_STRJU|nr:HNH endonuclease signature motif containing protein [Streptomyces jumonjinensis]MQT03164.1 HNH endonuclease [Streptomyces jumonjinensis]
MAANPRNGRPYRRLVDAQRALGLPCWICGHNIDGKLDGKRHPMAFTLDHLIPLSRGGSLLDPANARSAHRRCNSARGNRPSPPRQPVRSSRRW